jgi:uncharacterized protein (TIGR02646 family)
MIKVERQSKPSILQRKAEQWRAQLLAATTAAEPTRYEKRYGHREVKQRLVQMFHGKCAYCESKILHVDYGHIEHYRPKAARPDLTFEWTNLLLARGICNGAEYKSDHFPEAAEGGPIVNPCEDHPEEHFEFHFDPVAKLASVYGTTARGLLTEHLLGMNRPELRGYRSKRIRHLAALARFAETDDEAARLLEAAKQADSEYTAFAQALFR